MEMQYAGMTAYGGIKDIMDVTHFDEGRDATLMDQLGSVLLEHGVQGILGISLLHTHFKLESDELLIEMVEQDQVVSIPVRLSQIRRDIFPMTWRIQQGIAVPLHWRLGIDPNAAQVQAFLNNEGLKDVSRILGDERDRFGIIRISDFELALTEGAALLEETDIEQRILFSKVSPSSATAIQTAWYFTEESQPVLQAGRYCEKYTRRTCSRNCEMWNDHGNDSGSCPTGGHRSSHASGSHTYHDRVGR